jgi:hypothetical protein
VITNVGNVAAGSFDYKVFFQNCRSCASVAAASGNAACARMSGVASTPQR